LVEVGFAGEAFGVDFVDVFGAGGTGGAKAAWDERELSMELMPLYAYEVVGADFGVQLPL